MNHQANKHKKLFLFSFLIISSISQTFAQPNFIIIIADDQGWTGSSVQMDANVAGSKSDFYYTPEIEALAQAGMTFSQGYAPAPKCSPSRCSILTGRSTARNQFTNTDNQIATGEILIEPNSNTSFNGADTSLAEWIKSIGMDYQTAHFGKWHLGAAAASSPSSNGFDFNDGSTNNGDGNHGGTVQADPKKIFDLTDRSIDFIQDAVADGDPFFLQLSHYAVHADIEARQETIDLYNDPAQRPPGTIHTGVEYGAMTEDTDTGIGELLNAVTALGIDNNTYVIFMSDNGGQINVTDNSPLFRGKTFIYEGGIRVPFIIKGPNITPNSFNTEAIVAYDLFPTIAALTGSTADLPANLDGQNLVPLFSNGTFNRTEPLYFHSPHYGANPNKSPRSAVVDGNYKLIVEYQTGNNYLFDLSVDIGESNDLSASQPILAHDLCIKLRDHLKAVNASMPTLDPSHANFSGTAPDVDADGLNDAWEFTELLTYTYGPTDDPDGDGSNNLTEFNNGTDPYVDETVLALNENAIFKGEVTLDSKIKLSWVSMENGEVDFIEIERSENAFDWKTIGKVGANVSYFIDDNPKEGVNYYRLKVTNQEGEIDFSNTIGLILNAADIIKIFPNPASDLLHLHFKNSDILPSKFYLQIFEANGKLVKHLEAEKSNLVSIPIKNLPSGIYFLQLKTGFSDSERITIQFLVE